jgi:hypothetical protein
MTAAERVIDYAASRGHDEGQAAASWYFDGNTSTETYARTLRGIEDGDPVTLDTLPAADLSGQWADTTTGPSLTADAIRAAGLTHADGNDDPAPYGHAPGTCPACDWYDASGEIADAYESAFNDAVTDTIETACRRQLAP